MPVEYRINARSVVSSMVIALVVVTGCSTEGPSPANPGPPATPARGPAPGAKGINQDLEKIKDAVTPPLIIKPDQPTAPAPEPGKPG